jgi:hypothetical protein
VELSREERLEDLRRRRRNRTLPEVQALLVAWGFVKRAATKEGGGVWRRGKRVVTLPRPHGRDRVLHPRSVAMAIRQIEEAKRDDQEAD